MLTSLCALDGTLVMLVAAGVLESVPGALVTGLTVMAGAGTWIAARAEFAGRKWTRADAALLALLALVQTAAALAAAAAGEALAGASVDLRVLPRVSGVVLLLLALQVGGARLPAVGRVPLPAVVAGIGLVAEGVARWTP